MENCLRNALRQDRARIQIGRISRFGLLEMSRQRLRSSLTRSSHITCPRCDGEGTIRSIESLGLSIVHLIEEQASKVEHIHFQLQVPIDLAIYLINEKREILRDIEKRYPVKITVIPNQYMETPLYQLKQIKTDPASLEHGIGVPSYKLTKIFKAETSQKQEIKPLPEPAVQKFLSIKDTLFTATAVTHKTHRLGLFKRLIAKMFGTEKEVKSLLSKSRTASPTPQNATKSPGRGEKKYHEEQQRPRRFSSGNRQDDSKTSSPSKWQHHLP